MLEQLSKLPGQAPAPPDDPGNGTGQAGRARAGEAAAPADQPRYDWDRALELIGGDEELLLSVLAMFLDELPGYMQSLREELAGGDYPSAYRTAHTLKGLLSTFCAGEAAAAALAVEQQARDGPPQPASIDELNRLIADLTPRLAQRLHA